MIHRSTMIHRARRLHAKRKAFVGILLILFMLPAVISAQQGDGDGDGVFGAKDYCPNDPGPAENNGCPMGQPLPDRDSDGTADFLDFCPDVRGDSTNNGCPFTVELQASPTATAFNIPTLPTGGPCIAATGSTVDVNIREYPRLTAPIVGILNPFETVLVTARMSVGGEVWYRTERGWIIGYVMRLGGDCSNLPDIAIGPLAPPEFVLHFIYSSRIPVPEGLLLDSRDFCDGSVRLREYNPNGSSDAAPFAAPESCESQAAFGLSLRSADGNRRLIFPPVDPQGILIGLNQPSVDPTGILIGLNQPEVDPAGILIGLNQPDVDPTGILIGLSQPSVDLNGILIGLLQGTIDPQGILIGLLRDSADPQGILIGLLRDAETSAWGENADNGLLLFQTDIGTRSYLWGFHPGGANLPGWDNLAFVMSWVHPGGVNVGERGRVFSAAEFDPNGTFDAFDGEPFIANFIGPDGSALGVCSQEGCIGFDELP
ncbi:MAG: hypothetical protein U0670_07600 [Anaerolineae bacterium]